MDERIDGWTVSASARASIEQAGLSRHTIANVVANPADTVEQENGTEWRRIHRVAVQVDDRRGKILRAVRLEPQKLEWPPVRNLSTRKRASPGRARLSLAPSPVEVRVEKRFSKDFATLEEYTAYWTKWRRENGLG